MTTQDTLSAAIADYRAGREGAFDRLMPMIYDDLRRVARRQLRASQGQTLDTTALVHEIYLKLAGQGSMDAQDHAHLLAICARAMRQFIVSHARIRLAQKRGGRELMMVDIELQPVQIEADAEQLVLVDQALAQLARIDVRLVNVFECRYFAGLSESETALALDTPLRTVQRDWMRARAWLRELLGYAAPKVA